MKRYSIVILAALAAFTACNQSAPAPRPTIDLVLSIAADTSGAGHLVAQAGHQGALGTISIIGEPSQGLTLARRFQSADAMDNIDGRRHRDSLADFAGETFQVILDVYNAPYSHFFTESATSEERLDSLREAAVRNAMFAWDSTSRAKVLIFTSPMNAVYGLYDVDTLQQLTGGRSHLLSPVKTMLTDATENGASELAVWASREVRASKAYETVFAEMEIPGHVMVITPEQALDVRTRLRSLLRQYRSTGRKLDALLLDSYSLDKTLLLSEINMIRRAGTEEDLAFSKMLSPDFCILDPCTSVVDATYKLLRQEDLFTHHIHRPVVRYFETIEKENGEPGLYEVNSQYAHSAYVQDID